MFTGSHGRARAQTPLSNRASSCHCEPDSWSHRQPTGASRCRPGRRQTLAIEFFGLSSVTISFKGSTCVKPSEADYNFALEARILHLNNSDVAGAKELRVLCNQSLLPILEMRDQTFPKLVLLNELIIIAIYFKKNISLPINPVESFDLCRKKCCKPSRKASGWSWFVLPGLRRRATLSREPLSVCRSKSIGPDFQQVRRVWNTLVNAARATSWS